MPRLPLLKEVYKIDYLFQFWNQNYHYWRQKNYSKFSNVSHVLRMKCHLTSRAVKNTGNIFTVTKSNVSQKRCLTLGNTLYNFQKMASDGTECLIVPDEKSYPINKIPLVRKRSYNPSLS